MADENIATTPHAGSIKVHSELLAQALFDNDDAAVCNGLTNGTAVPATANEDEEDPEGRPGVFDYYYEMPSQSSASKTNLDNNSRTHLLITRSSTNKKELEVASDTVNCDGLDDNAQSAVADVAAVAMSASAAAENDSDDDGERVGVFDYIPAQKSKTHIVQRPLGGNQSDCIIDMGGSNDDEVDWDTWKRQPFKPDCIRKTPDVEMTTFRVSDSALRSADTAATCAEEDMPDTCCDGRMDSSTVRPGHATYSRYTADSAMCGKSPTVNVFSTEYFNRPNRVPLSEKNTLFRSNNSYGTIKRADSVPASKDVDAKLTFSSLTPAASNRSTGRDSAVFSVRPSAPTLDTLNRSIASRDCCSSGHAYMDSTEDSGIDTRSSQRDTPNSEARNDGHQSPEDETGSGEEKKAVQSSSSEHAALESTMMKSSNVVYLNDCRGFWNGNLIHDEVSGISYYSPERAAVDRRIHRKRERQAKQMGAVWKAEDVPEYRGSQPVEEILAFINDDEKLMRGKHGSRGRPQSTVSVKTAEEDAKEEKERRKKKKKSGSASDKSNTMKDIDDGSSIVSSEPASVNEDCSVPIANTDTMYRCSDDSAENVSSPSHQSSVLVDSACEDSSVKSTTSSVGHSSVSRKDHVAVKSKTNGGTFTSGQTSESLTDYDDDEVECVRSKNATIEFITVQKKKKQPKPRKDLASTRCGNWYFGSKQYGDNSTSYAFDGGSRRGKIASTPTCFTNRQQSPVSNLDASSPDDGIDSSSKVSVSDSASVSSECAFNPSNFPDLSNAVKDTRRGSTGNVVALQRSFDELACKQSASMEQHGTSAVFQLARPTAEREVLAPTTTHQCDVPAAKPASVSVAKKPSVISYATVAAQSSPKKYRSGSEAERRHSLGHISTDLPIMQIADFPPIVSADIAVPQLASVCRVPLDTLDKNIGNKSNLDNMQHGDKVMSSETSASKSLYATDKNILAASDTKHSPLAASSSAVSCSKNNSVILTFGQSLHSGGCNSDSVGQPPLSKTLHSVADVGTSTTNLISSTKPKKKKVPTATLR